MVLPPLDLDWQLCGDTFRAYNLEELEEETQKINLITKEEGL